MWTFELAKSNPLSPWLFQKPSFAKYTVSASPNLTASSRKSLRSSPPELQEALLVEDLLDVMIGFEGAFIKRKPGTPYYVI